MIPRRNKFDSWSEVPSLSVLFSEFMSCSFLFLSGAAFPFEQKEEIFSYTSWWLQVFFTEKCEFHLYIWKSRLKLHLETVLIFNRNFFALHYPLLLRKYNHLELKNYLLQHHLPQAPSHLWIWYSLLFQAKFPHQ